MVAVLNAVLGTALGLFVSAFAETEFQAVQFMPALVLPQVLLCGLFVPRDALPDVLGAVSDVLPLSYAVDAMQEVQAASDVDHRPHPRRHRRRRQRTARAARSAPPPSAAAPPDPLAAERPAP